MMGVLVVLAGGLGALARWKSSAPLNRGFPWGTFAVNVLGSFAAGACAAHPHWHWGSVVAVGFLGGFTTFSTASVESREQSRIVLWRGAAHSVGTLICCVAAAALGFELLG